MPERPLLKLPKPQSIDPPRKPGGGPRIVRPDRGRQGERMAPRFERHQGYRMAALDVSPGNSEDKYWVTSQRVPCQPTDKTVARGTVFHEQRRGEEAAVFVDDGHILLRVSCRSAAGDLEEAVPYALAVSFEVAAEADIAVYDDIRTRLVAEVRAGVAPHA